jgi:ectoine hydroxylase-related dioxygenase (phytanoyl-CoA dioxygenase family)
LPDDAFLRDGFAILPQVIPDSEIDALGAAIDGLTETPGTMRREGTLYGMRDALRGVTEVRQLARSETLLNLVSPVIGPEAFAVRALLFDKTPEANWGVPWHQDLTIAVEKRVDMAGFGPWTLKAGIDHVRPPVEVLERMVTLRVHLDDCGVDQGPLRVVPGSHAEGRLEVAATQRWVERGNLVTCLVPRGGVVMMRPLILHASSPADSPRRRRVVHLEYAASPLPGGLNWFESAH